jgi:nucleoid-associated protein YgaU
MGASATLGAEPAEQMWADGSVRPPLRTSSDANPKGANNTMKYVVKSGDTLSKIAKEFYGDGNRWREIFEANKDQIENPSQIRPGWELLIPGLADDKGDKPRRAGRPRHEAT